MTTRPPNLAPAPRPAAPSWDLSVPAWTAGLVAAAPVEAAVANRLGVEVRSTPAASLVTVRVPNAAGLSPAEFGRATADAYTAIAGRLSDLPAHHPVRFWNYIPGIHQPCGGRGPGDESAPATLDRYMVFNAGRYAACSRWLGGEQAFPRLLATASGVGHDGTDLVIHALAAAAPGVAVENPRQVPAYRYSSRYGPRPPCFARATLVTLGGGGAGAAVRPAVLVGGTASVRGEESVFVGDVRGQAGETLDNLAALLQAATGDPAAGPHLFTDVRVYVVRPADEAALRPLCERAFPAAGLEFVRADICRQDLLVEIEGVAAVTGGGTS